jgi:hypothetical protein
MGLEELWPMTKEYTAREYRQDEVKIKTTMLRGSLANGHEAS